MLLILYGCTCMFLESYMWIVFTKHNSISRHTKLINTAIQCLRKNIYLSKIKQQFLQDTKIFRKKFHCLIHCHKRIKPLRHDIKHKSWCNLHAAWIANSIDEEEYFSLIFPVSYPEGFPLCRCFISYKLSGSLDQYKHPPTLYKWRIHIVVFLSTKNKQLLCIDISF